MTLALILNAAVLLVLSSAVAVAVAMRGSRRVDGPSLVGKTVVVTTDRDRTFRGVVLAEHADRVTLHQAFVVTPVGETAVGGLVHLPRTKFDALQQIDAPVEKPRDPTLVSR